MDNTDFAKSHFYCKSPFVEGENLLFEQISSGANMPLWVDAGFGSFIFDIEQKYQWPPLIWEAAKSNKAVSTNIEPGFNISILYYR